MGSPPVNWNNVSMLTPGMKNLGNQFNKRWPNRDGTSDGAIGDYAHSQGKSGHNPDDNTGNAEWEGDADKKKEVRAIDTDDDLNDPTCNMQDVIDHMRKLKNLSSVIRYMIYNRKIYSASNNFNPENYTGSSPHTEHAHFSGAYSDSSDENTSFNFKFEEVGNDVGTVEGFSADAYNDLVKAATAGVLSYGAIGSDGTEEGGVTDLPGQTATNVLNILDTTCQNVLALTEVVSRIANSSVDTNNAVNSLLSSSQALTEAIARLASSAEAQNTVLANVSLNLEDAVGRLDTISNKIDVLLGRTCDGDAK